MKKLNNQFKMHGEIKDRGNIKWQGLMLPEHIQMLREWYKEDDEVKRPELDEFDLQLIQEELDIAAKRKCEVLIETWRDKQIFKHRGIIERIDPAHREIVYESPFGMERVVLDEVVAVTLID